MKKSLFVLTLLAIGLTSLAQQKDTLRINVNGNEIIILTDDVNSLTQTDYNAIIKRLSDETQRIVADYTNEIAAINKKQQAGELTAEQAEAQRQAANAKMEADMDALSTEIENWADRYGAAMEENAEDPEAWAAQWESNAQKYETVNPPAAPNAPEAPEAPEEGTTVIINDEGVVITGEGDWDPDKVKEAKEKYKRNQTIGYGSFHFGWANWLNADGIAKSEGTNTTTELNFWPSMVWGFGFGGKTRMGESKMYIRYGMEFNWNYFQMKGNTILVKYDDVILETEGVAFYEDESQNYSKSAFRISYWDAPVLFEFDNSKPGQSDGFSLGLGGYGGIRMGSHTKVKYSDFNGDKSEVKQQNNYYTNGWRYGLLGQVGFGTFKITAKYDLNHLFRTDKTTPDYQIASLTLGWVFP